MADILIRDVPEHVVAALDERARKLGLSRSEFLRRQLSAEAQRTAVTVEDLAGFAETFADLADPAVMGGAWS
ncbi:MAG: ribbon-helix-helix protein, CopG family [Acidimicrobiia bacterium]|nr:ribbon-helix-helix protein, CopG family [Acidimicrobiia bacterium]